MFGTHLKRVAHQASVRDALEMRPGGSMTSRSAAATDLFITTACNHLDG